MTARYRSRYAPGSCPGCGAWTEPDCTCVLEDVDDEPVASVDVENPHRPSWLQPNGLDYYALTARPGSDDWHD